MDTVITILGTRPEIIRLSRIIPKLDKVCNHILVHTGQNYDPKLSGIFFKDLKLRQPDYYLGAKGTMAEQIAIILRETEKIFIKEKPDKLLILGDTNSGLSAIIAERMGIPVYHMEAGNRCYDLEVPEEINRKIIDHISTYNFPYTPGSRENLIEEGLNKTRIIRSGNPIYEVLGHYSSQIKKSKILDTLNLKSKEYFLATFHRAECVDKRERLEQIMGGLEIVAHNYNMPIIVSVHPRTRQKLDKWGLKSINKNIKFLEPLGFFDFVKLEENALCMISDSGTCCEEGTLLYTPTVICRKTTERPETVKVGSAIVSGIMSKMIGECVDIMVNRKLTWEQPKGYIDSNVSEKMIKYLIGRL